jgi:glutathione S-transferase
MGDARNLPVLWQLELSHYNEKVRWALDHKRIPHVRRSLLPGVHVVATRRLTGSVGTTPVLTLDGRSIGDSTRIIAALEERWPEPPLYPVGDEPRRRALELEDYFDEELGPHVRRAVYHVLLEHPQLVVPLFAHGQRLPARLLLWAAFPVLRLVIRQRLTVTGPVALDSRERAVAAMDRLEREIGPSGYLVGDRFTVADLTAASLLYPVIRPPQFPYPSVAEVPAEAREFLDSLARRPAGQWVTEMYARHRLPEANQALGRPG